MFQTTKFVAVPDRTRITPRDDLFVYIDLIEIAFSKVYNIQLPNLQTPRNIAEKYTQY